MLSNKTKFMAGGSLILVCPECKKDLIRLNPAGLECFCCGNIFPVLNNVVFFAARDNAKKEVIDFYKNWQESIDNYNLEYTKNKQSYNKLIPRVLYLELRGFFRKNIMPRKNLFLFCDYFNKRKDFFFEDFFADKPRGLILDLGCGRGSELFARFGEVAGVDINPGLFAGSKAPAGYAFFAHCDVLKLPFRDNQFDCIVSSDFLEHIPPEEKGPLYREINRVLKPGGRMAHFATTDSKNTWFEFAHSYPELFQKYLIKEIGGHYGLQFPGELIRNIENHNFKLVSSRKMLWEPVEFFLRFDNEYKNKSLGIRAVVSAVKMLMKNEFVFFLVNIPVGAVFRLIEFFMPLDYSNKIGVVFKKAE